MTRTPRRTLAATALAGALVVLAAGPASAHVHVTPSSAAPGSYPQLEVSVPNERDVPTTEVSVTLPDGVEFARYEDVPGWEAEVVKDGGEVTSVTWRATGDGIGVDGFQRFALVAGPVSEGRVELPTLQTYADGYVSRWIEPTVDGEAEPESPAPYLDVVTGAAGADQHGSVDPAAGGHAQATEAGTAPLAPLLISGLALVAALAALGLGLRRR